MTYTLRAWGGLNAVAGVLWGWRGDVSASASCTPGTPAQICGPTAASLQCTGTCMHTWGLSTRHRGGSRQGLWAGREFIALLSWNNVDLQARHSKSLEPPGLTRARFGHRWCAHVIPASTTCRVLPGSRICLSV